MSKAEDFDLWVSRIRMERALDLILRPESRLPVIPGHPLPRSVPAPCQPIGCDGGYHIPGCELEGFGA